MLINESIVLLVVGSITCVHSLALLWDIWMSIWLGDEMVAYHELSPRTCAAELIRQCVSVSSKCDKGTVSNMADEDTMRMRGLFNFHKKLADTRRRRLMMQQCTLLWLILQLVLLIVLLLSQENETRNCRSHNLAWRTFIFVEYRTPGTKRI